MTTYLSTVRRRWSCLTLNALVAADNVIIPMQCEYYALEGIADLMTTIRMCNKRLNPSLRGYRASS